MLPRHHAVVNAESGMAEGNQVARIPSASDWGTWSELQNQLWRMRPADAAPARLFDGDAVPRLADAPDFATLRPVEESTDGRPSGGPRGPVALLGEIIDVQSRSAGLRLPRAPGRNLAVLGTRVDEACAVLDTAARSLHRQHRPGAARFSIACLDPDAESAARSLYDVLGDDAAWYDEETVPELMTETASGLGYGAAPGEPHYLLLYAVDAAAGRLAGRTGGRTGLEHLRQILHDGPERRTHVLAWWRGVARMRADLGGPASRTDQIGAWVALDVQGAELGSALYPGTGGPDWYPRPWRGLFFDRAVHRTARGDHPLRTGPMSETYAELIRRLADTTARMDAERAEAQGWYAGQCAGAERAVRDAEQAVRRAEAELAAAREESERTDAEVLHLWQTLRDRLGAAAGRIGDPPVPTAGAPTDPTTLLDGVRDLLDRTRQPGELPSSVQPLLAIFGVLGAAVAYALGFAARAAGIRYGGDLAVGMPVLSVVVTLFGPLVGLAPAKLLADRRHAGLDPRAVTVVVVAGVLTTGTLFALVR